MLRNAGHAEDVVVDRVAALDCVWNPSQRNLLRQDCASMALGNVRAQVQSSRELLAATRLWAGEVLRLLVLVQHDLVVEGLVTEEAKWLHV